MESFRLNHRNDLDLLKGFAIIAVVLYHMGISRSGYLGVDAFFVINGFFIMPRVTKDVADGKFHYFSFMEKRIMRLLPLILLATGLSLLVGYWSMLPDDYENLSESVIGTNLFSNNILASITTKNYWDVSNDYKPLMHTWYIGILFEFYLTLPLIALFIKWLCKKLHIDFYKYFIIAIVILSFISLLLYCNPSAKVGEKFYLLHYRFYELASGGLAGIWIARQRKGAIYENRILSALIFIFLALLMFVSIIYVEGQTSEYSPVMGIITNNKSLIPQEILLLSTVLLTILFVICNNIRSQLISSLINMKIFCKLGIMSYSIFIWHQPLLAFYRYSISNDFTTFFIIVFLVVVFVISYITYRFVEKKVKINKRSRVIAIFAFTIINGVAFAIFMHAGVVRDVPELNVQMNNVHRNMHADYVDRIYAYDKDFPLNNGKMNVVVIGHSFARDWGNILLESEMADKINLSYIYKIDSIYIPRISHADYIFIFDWKHNVPKYIWDNIKPNADVWGIGTKNFGESNGIMYKNRYRPDYFKQTIKIKPTYFLINNLMKKEWGDKYIDLLSLSVVDDGRVVVFSDDHKFMSQDTRHLSEGGAKYFAKKIDFKTIFK